MPYYGPGMPWYGRGAGNIHAAQQELARREDLEANLVSRTPSTTDHSEPQNPPYVGRGGLGNYGHLHELTEASSDDPSLRGRRESQPQSPTYGRGGVGNYNMGAVAVQSKENAMRRAMDDERKRQKVQIDVEKGVEEQLAAPQKARVNAGRQSIH